MASHQCHSKATLNETLFSCRSYSSAVCPGGAFGDRSSILSPPPRDGHATQTSPVRLRLQGIAILSRVIHKVEAVVPKVF